MKNKTVWFPKRRYGWVGVFRRLGKVGWYWEAIVSRSTSLHPTFIRKVSPLLGHCA